ncbi:hypothetical protein A2U01_0088788, partial [Trifolium medium]|nr:hypothetical protein [Trifolium medium]
VAEAGDASVDVDVTSGRGSATGTVSDLVSLR